MEMLFSPFTVKGCRLSNRIVMPGLASFLIGSDGAIDERTVEHYRRRASGGPAMVIVEACAVSPEGIVSPHQARIYDDRFIEGLSRIAGAMKSEGAVPAVQIHHGGRQTSAKVIGQRPLAPSPLPCPSIRGEVEPLTCEGIQDLVRKFGDAAERAVQAGFELIEVHGAHGYLINQFLSRFSNIRQDRYGGDVEGRSRFAVEIVREIRGRLGEDFPLSFKISAREFVQNGLDVPESIEILKFLAATGIDIVQVSAGNDATPEWICQPMFMDKACLADAAAEVRRHLRVPVMAVGRINDPAVADDIIASGKADLVCMGRGLLADPELPRKAREGRYDEIRKCIACNTCMEAIFRKGRVECLVNPALGRENEMAIQEAETRKKIMVIGAGPGGLNLSWVAAKRGHEVHLYEKNEKIGGQLLLGSVSRYKAELRELIRFQETQIRKYGVHCHMPREATLDTVHSLCPDVVVLATGASPRMPEIEGIGRAFVFPFTAALDGGLQAGVKTVVLGGGPTGCEVALHLAEGGCPVTIVEVLPVVGAKLETMTRKVLLQKLRERGVEILTGLSASCIDENGVTLCGEDGRTAYVPAGQVVVAIGTAPETALGHAISQSGFEVHHIGDCLEPRSAKNALFESAVLARRL